MRTSPRTILLLAAALLAAWPSGAHASASGRIAACTCAAQAPLAPWDARDRQTQVDTPPARPAVDPCTGEPLPRTPADQAQEASGPRQPEGQAPRVDPCTGEPLPRTPADQAQEAAGPQQPDTAAPRTPPSTPPTDVTSPAQPAPREAEPVEETPAVVRAAPADPETADDNRDLLRLQTLALRDAVRPGPAGSVSVPTAFGVETGEVFLGVAFQARTRYTEDADAGLVVGTGIGSRRWLALEVALTSYSTIRGGGAGETGGLSFKLHRSLPAEASIAAGYENALLWGDSDADPALYVVGSKIVRRTRDPDRLLDAAVITLGVGNGRFRREEDDEAGRDRANLFGALGLRVSDPVSLAADWTGQDLNAGISVMPFRGVPLVVTPAVADILGTAGDGARFVLSIGYGIGFRSLF